MEKVYKVGIGDMKLARGEGSIITYALGSCIGITFYDPMLHLGALLHIMLPSHFNNNDPNLFKFADSGIRETIRKMTVFGMLKSRTVVKIAGGAKMFEISGNTEFGNIGARNIARVKEILREEGMRLTAEDTGGTYARTMQIDIETGSVSLRTVGKIAKKL